MRPLTARSGRLETKGYWANALPSRTEQVGVDSAVPTAEDASLDAMRPPCRAKAFTFCNEGPRAGRGSFLFRPPHEHCLDRHLIG